MVLKREETEREACYNYLDDCLQSVGANGNIVLVGDLDVHVDDELVEDMVVVVVPEAVWPNCPKLLK